MAKDHDKQETEIVPDEENSGEETALKKLKENLKKCESEKKEYLDGWQRAKADYINYKKDEGKRFEDMARFVAGGLVQDILPVLDSFDLALGHGLPKESERGILLIRSQLEVVLRKRGVEEIVVEAGPSFDPALEESLGEVESPHQAGAVAEVVQRGYRFRDKVIRPARVRISKEK
mgnify:FL=1